MLNNSTPYILTIGSDCLKSLTWKQV